MLDCELFGLKAGWYHMTSLLFHIANTLLLFSLFKKITGRVFCSGFVAAAFALHPQHVESVAWIAARNHTVSTFLGFLTIIAYVRYVEKQNLKWYISALLFFGLGLMTKSTLITLPFILLLLDYWPLNRFSTAKYLENNHNEKNTIKFKNPQWKVLMRLIWEKAFFFFFSAISISITFFLQKDIGKVQSLSELSITTRIANSLISCTTYITKTIWPTHLAVFYPHPLSKVSIWWALVSALLLLVISIVVIRLAQSRKYLLVGWLWYIGTLFPVIGLVQSGRQAMADRYTYISIIGLFIIVAWGLSDLLNRWKHKRIVLSISALIAIVLMTICTRIQVIHWRNTISLFEHALKVTEGNYLAHTSIEEPLRKEGRFEEAIFHNTEALRIKPDYFKPHINLGILLAKRGNLDEAIKHYKTALQIDSESLEAHNNLGNALMQQGKLDEAVTHFKEAIRIEPNKPEILANLGILLSQRNKPNEAIEHFNKALQIEPNLSNAHIALGMIFSQQNNLQDAIKHFSEAIRINPKFAMPYYHLAKVQIQKGEIKAAIENLKKALLINSRQPFAMNDLARLLVIYDKAEFHNPQVAIPIAKRACELTNFSDPGCVDTLAMAHAALGKFSQAVFISEQALKIARSSGKEELAKQIQYRLSLYKIGKAYTQPLPNPASN